MPLEIHNPTRIPRDFAIFYCWQDLLNRKQHRYLIRSALTKAISRVQSELPDDVDCTLRFDSDTAGRAGAVDIADAILSKIRSSTMLVADVTPCLRDSANHHFYPNPNVMFEVGYGARALGWSRIVCVFNKGNAVDDSKLRAEDFPFDIRHRRLNSYVCRADSGVDQATKELEAELVSSIRAVIQEIDRGEFDPTLGDASLRRARDIELLWQLMSTIHIDTMDQIIERGEELNVHYEGLFFWSAFSSVVNSAHFRFYDKDLQELALELHKVWSEAVNLGGLVLFPNEHTLGYSLLPENEWTNEYANLVKAMGRAYESMHSSIRALLDYVHELYPEINIDETDRTAWENYLPYKTTTKTSPKARKSSTKKAAVKNSRKRSR